VLKELNQFSTISFPKDRSKLFPTSQKEGLLQQIIFLGHILKELTNWP
jgi:hypothetical protein